MITNGQRVTGIFSKLQAILEGCGQRVLAGSETHRQRNNTCAEVNIPKTRNTYCKKCKKHTPHKVWPTRSSIRFNAVMSCRARAHTHTQIRTQACAHIPASTCVYTYAHTHTHTHLHMHTHVHVHIRTPTHTRTANRVQRLEMDIPASTHTLTHMHMHTCTCTHFYTYGSYDHMCR